jgi:hypothetical protein
VRLLLRLVPVLVRGLVRGLVPARELVPELLLVPELVPELLPELLQALLQARLQVPELLRLPRQPLPLRLRPTLSTSSSPRRRRCLAGTCKGSPPKTRRK